MNKLQRLREDICSSYFYITQKFISVYKTCIPNDSGHAFGSGQHLFQHRLQVISDLKANVPLQGHLRVNTWYWQEWWKNQAKSFLWSSHPLEINSGLPFSLVFLSWHLESPLSIFLVQHEPASCTNWTTLAICLTAVVNGIYCVMTSGGTLNLLDKSASFLSLTRSSITTVLKGMCHRISKEQNDHLIISISGKNGYLEERSLMQWS